MQLVIDLPPREEQLAFNRRRWEEICADPELARIEGKIESNGLGQVLVMPPASGPHSHRMWIVQRTLVEHLHGIALPECPVLTIDGVRAADVGWYSDERYSRVRGQLAFEMAPEICVEVLSPRNTKLEIDAKKGLYFDAGAEEVWICDLEGRLAFFRNDAGHSQGEAAEAVGGFSEKLAARVHEIFEC